MTSGNGDDIRDLIAARSRRQRRRRLVGALQYGLLLVGLAATSALIVVQLVENNGKPDSTTLGFAALALALLLPIGAPRAAKRWVGAISNLKVGGVEVALREVDLAARIAPKLIDEAEDGVTVEPLPKGGKASERALHLRLRVLDRLCLCRDRILELPKETEPSLVAARLRAECLLTDDEARMIGEVIGDLPEAIDRWPDESATEFLENAWGFVSRLGSTVFDRMARRELKRMGWLLCDFEQRKGHRPDFLAYRAGKWSLMTARIPGNPTKTVERLEKVAKRGFRDIAPEAGVQISSAIVVIPDERTPPEDGGGPVVEVRTLSSLST